MKFFPISKYTIVGVSMSPTFTNGQTILVNRYSYLFNKPKKGDIVAIKDPRDEKILIKRVEKLGKEGVFVIGDNKAHSTDSRKFGMIGKQQIIGKVVLL